MRILGELAEGVAIAWDTLRANKLRSVLTTLGIVIGVMTVTLMATAIDGVNQSFHRSISMLGADVLYVVRQNWFIESYEEWQKIMGRRPIDRFQVEAVERQMTLAQAVAPLANASRPVQFGEYRSDSVFVIGTTDQYPYVSSTPVEEGRFFTPEESDGGRPVCVVGHQVATNLFREVAPLGQTIRISGRSFEVIGTLEPMGQFLGTFSLDNQILVPLRQFFQAFDRNPDLQIQVKVGQPELIDDAREELRGIMRKARRVAPVDDDDFAIEQQDSLVSVFNRVAGIIAAVGLFITGLSLFVGGIGIMNIMFVSVAERTREIGLRKAVGAKRRAILIQFLIESAAICLLGGFIALSITWPLTLALNQLLPARLSPVVVALAIGISLVTGVCSGLIPAWRAARLDPVEALRNE